MLKKHGVAAIDYGFGVDGGLRFVLVENESAVSYFVGGGVGGHFGGVVRIDIEVTGGL